MNTPPPDIRKRLAETVNAVRDRVDIVPRVGIVLGRDLAGFSDRMRNVIEMPYAAMPHMPARSTGPDGKLLLGFVDDVPVACLAGRVNLGEGFPAWQVVHGARTIARLGAKTVLVAETAGVLEPTWSVGDIMLVTDHLNLTFHEGLGDLQEPDFEQFPNMRAAYDPGLCTELHEVVRAENMLSARVGTKTSIEIVEGVYASLRDPSYETPAQVRMLLALGAQAVGTSTVVEVTALRQLGVRVAALAYLAYRAADTSDSDLDDEPTASSSLTQFHRLLRGWIVRAHRS